MKTLDYYMRLPYASRVTPDTYSDGSRCYFAEIPELPGCESHGNTPEEALASLEDAKELYLHSLLEEGLTPPKPSGMAASVIWRDLGTARSGTGFQPAVLTGCAVRPLASA